MIVDAAAYLGAWPFRPVKGTVSGLARMMEANGVGQALVSPFEGLFYTDPAAANARLLKSVGGRKNVWAAPIINLKMADWREQMEALSGERQVRAVRLAPGFHGYEVSEAREAVEEAGARGLTTVVQIRMQDERHQRRPVAQIPEVPLDDVLALAAAAPRARVIASAARLGEMLSQAEHARQLGNLWLDTSHLDGLGCVKQALEAVGGRRLVFSTCWPFFYARSAVLKMEEAEVPRRAAEAVMGGNAARALRIE
jgi:predicted TIM-barrel fold metal-dependent hydrolase